MLIFPAIDLYEKKAVRLFKGDYNQMTVYNENPCETAADFVKCGASWIHIVDLEGAKSGDTPNLDTVCDIKKTSGLLCEVGGGIRSLSVIDKYVLAGIDRVILGTAAVTDMDFCREAVKNFGEKIAVGVDIKDGYAAVRGWTEKSALTAYELCERMQDIGVTTLICTDISKDGAMQGTNVGLYEELSNRFDMKIIASGGVSSLEDVRALRKLDIYGAIIGKAYYTGSIDLSKAIEVAK
ncbi:MAG: 1-(5-phosphoribosyl)-5-[Oscillospiraceae bacterium]|nr:1-(5-phosphoribosyl)-5-[(5-phosphoribosylamino)methylideneamino]imidazole-4-carboxamide isomerase [Oscillospiraceae bacterium]MBQ4544295.1 1-(5-phosphoribosyl)-5-[(5-phosphoribosylamino)methylideneamino]imidazole-4-carboxamide isomerase [Oscillospiraceae bacterium]